MRKRKKEGSRAVDKSDKRVFLTSTRKEGKRAHLETHAMFTPSFIHPLHLFINPFIPPQSLFSFSPHSPRPPACCSPPIHTHTLTRLSFTPLFVAIVGVPLLLTGTPSSCTFVSSLCPFLPFPSIVSTSSPVHTTLHCQSVSIFSCRYLSSSWILFNHGPFDKAVQARITRMLSPDSSAVSTAAAASVASVTVPESIIPMASSLPASSSSTPSSSSSSITPLSPPPTKATIEPDSLIETQVLPSGHNNDSDPGYTNNEENRKEQLRAVSSNSIAVSALPAVLPQESTLSTSALDLPASTLPRPSSPSTPIAVKCTVTTTTATAAPSTRPPSRISLDQFSGERSHAAPPTSQSPSGSPQCAGRPPSVTIDVSDTVAQEDPPGYMAGNDPQQQPDPSTVSASAVLAEDSSGYRRHQHHHSLSFGSDSVGLENGVDPGPGTSAYHARLLALSQQHSNFNQEGARPPSSSLSWRSPPSIWSRERAPGILPSDTNTGVGRHSNDEDNPVLLRSTSPAAIPLAMFRRPFLEEDELPEYMSLPEQGLPFKIPAVQSITYTVIPSQGPDEFQQRQEPEDDIYHDSRLSHEDSPIDPIPVSSSSSAAEIQIDVEPSLSPQLVGPGSQLQVPAGSSPLSSQRLRQESQSGRPWTLEYWVDDTIMYLLYLMDPKHSATTSLVPRTTEVHETRTTLAAATMQSTPVGSRFMTTPAASMPNETQVEPAAPSAPARTSISSMRGRYRNWNGASTPGASILSGFSSAPSRSRQRVRQPSNQSSSLSTSPVAVSNSSQQLPALVHGLVSREEEPVIVTMESVPENENPVNHHAGDDVGVVEQDDGDSTLERVPVGHIRGRPPPLTRRPHGGWPTINPSNVNRPSRQHRFFGRSHPPTSFSAEVVPTSSSSPARTTEAPPPTSESDMAHSSSAQLLPASAIQSEIVSIPAATDSSRVVSLDEGTTENVETESPSLENQTRPPLEETGQSSRRSSLAPPFTIIRTTLPSVQHVHINDGYAGEEADVVLAHTLQATMSPSTSAGDPRTVQRNNAYNNALTSEFFKHPSFAFVSAEDPQTWIWWSTHHESNLQRCRQEGPMEEVMMWWRTRVDYKSKENKEKRRLEKQRKKALGLEDENKKATKHLGLVDRWKRFLSLESSTQHRQSMEITMRVRGLYYAWREEEVIAEEAELLMQQQQVQQQQNISLLSTPQPPESPPPMSFHSDDCQDFTDGVNEDQGSQFGMTSIRPRSISTTPLPPPPPPASPPPLFPAISRRTKSRFFQLVRDDSLVNGQRVKGGPVAEVWITEEPDEDDEYNFHGRSGANISGGSHHQHHSGEDYASSPAYQSVLDSSPSGQAPFYPLVRSDRSSSVTSNNGNTFMTDVSAATGGPVRSSTMTGPLIRPVPSGRSYASSSRYPLSDMDTPAPSFRDAMTTGGGASSGYYGPGNGGHSGEGHASGHRRQRSSVAFSSSRASSLAPTTDDVEHEDGHHHHHHHHHNHDSPRQTDGRTGDDDSSSSSFPKSLRRRKCTIRVMKSLNDETSTFVLSTGPRLPELFDLFTDQSLPGPSRGAFICSVVTFAIVFLIIFVSLAFTHRGAGN